MYKKNDRVGGQFFVIWRFLSATKVVSKVEVDMEEVGGNEGIDTEVQLNAYRTIVVIGVDSRGEVEESGNSDTLMMKRPSKLFSCIGIHM